MSERSFWLSAPLLILGACSQPAAPRPLPPAPAYPSTRSAISDPAPPAEPSTVPAENRPLLAPAEAEDKATASCTDCLVHLDRFYRALDELEADRRESNVRILWLGDSHTAADFLTDQVRRDLEQFFPSGGPGYVPLGHPGTRHGSLGLESSGRWRRQPRDPATQQPTADGVFGYGGVRTVPGSGASARVTPKGRQVRRADLAYRLGPGDSLEVRFGVESRRLSGPTASSHLAHAIFALEPTAPVTPFSVRQLSGNPELFGVDLTALEPGLVLDTVGINGARLGTALAWNRDVFESELKLRDPSLVVLMFGTNEIFDRRDPSVYEEHAVELLSRVRAAVPGADCWIIGPPDAATTTGTSRERVALVSEAEQRAARRSECAFSSLFSLMGGPGSFSEWIHKSPPLARPDNIHLTVQGYEELGRRLSALLLSSRTVVAPEPPTEAPPQSGLVASRAAPYAR